MAFTPPTVADFKAQFARDFLYTSDISTGIVDADITTALTEAGIHFNEGKFETAAQKVLVFLYLTAFYLVWNIQNSSQGIASSGKFIISSKSAGGVSVSYQIPERFQNDPLVMLYSKNEYGIKYL